MSDFKLLRLIWKGLVGLATVSGAYAFFFCVVPMLWSLLCLAAPFVWCAIKLVLSLMGIVMLVCAVLDLLDGAHSDTGSYSPKHRFADGDPGCPPCDDVVSYRQERPRFDPSFNCYRVDRRNDCFRPVPCLSLAEQPGS